MLASSVFGSYHLIIFAAFPLLLAQPANRELDRGDLVLLFASIFMLIPKCYLFYRGVTPDAVLNPLVLLLAASYLTYHQLAFGAQKVPSGEYLPDSPTEPSAN
jgi:hypothetical protein